MDHDRPARETRVPARYEDIQISWGPNQPDVWPYEAYPDAYVEHAVPQYVSYTNEETGIYLVRDLAAGQMRQVTKYRAPTHFALRSVPTIRGTAIFRWSVVALIGAVVGGIGGLVLGVPILLIAVVQKAGLSGRMRRWRRRNAGKLLPPAARIEYDLVRGAMWQSGFAIIIGSLVLLFLLTRM
jgi:hypothetical protein